MGCILKLLLISAAAGVICSGQGVARKLPDHVRLVQSLAQNREPLQLNRLRAVSPDATRQQSYTARCAHIVVHRPDPRIDPKFSLGVPDAGKWNMPLHKGMPVCPQDVR